MANLTCPQCQADVPIVLDEQPAIVDCSHCGHIWTPEVVATLGNESMPPPLPESALESNLARMKASYASTQTVITYFAGRFELQCLNCGFVHQRPYRFRTKSKKRKVIVQQFREFWQDVTIENVNFACPVCYAVNPSKVGEARQTWDILTSFFGASVLFLFLLIAEKLPLPDCLAFHTLNTLVALGLLFVYWAIERRARLRIAKLNEITGDPTASQRLRRWPAYIHIGVGALLLASYPLVQINYPTPTTVDCGSSFAILGEPTRVNIASTNPSQDGMWSGRATVDVLNQDDFSHPLYVRPSTPTLSPSNRKRSAPSKEVIPKTYIDVTLPNDQRLVSRPVELLITLDVIYPIFTGEKIPTRFNTVTIHRYITLTPISKTTAYINYLFEFLAVFFGLLFCGSGMLIICRSSYRLTRISTPQQDTIEECDTAEMT